MSSRKLRSPGPIDGAVVLPLSPSFFSYRQGARMLAIETRADSISADSGVAVRPHRPDSLVSRSRRHRRGRRPPTIGDHTALIYKLSVCRAEPFPSVLVTRVGSTFCNAAF